jgi:hypothetical protein
MSQKSMNSEASSEVSQPGWLGILKGQVESLRFGTVQVVVHESRVVQIERTEKVRFDRPEGATSPGASKELP